MKLLEIAEGAAEFRKLLVTLAKWSPGNFELKNGVYVSTDPTNKDVEMRVAASGVEKYNRAHIKLQYPDTTGQFARFKELRDFLMNNTRVTNPRSDVERYENHPGMQIYWWDYDLVGPKIK